MRNTWVVIACLAWGLLGQAAQGPIKMIVHVNFDDKDRQEQALKNVHNVLEETQGKAEMEVVAHGAGIGLLLKERSGHAEKIEGLIKRGVRFVACENTLKQKSISKDKLLANVPTVPSGAVELARRQSEGYAYFKP